MNEVFQVKSTAPYYLRDRNELYSRNPKTVAYGTASVSFMAPKIWSIVPRELKNSPSLYYFKNGIRKWKLNCPCRLCKTYLQHVDFGYWNKNLFYFVNYMSCDRCIFFIFFHIEMSRLTQKQNG